MRFASPSLYSVCSGETPPGTMWRVGWAVAECSGAGMAMAFTAQFAAECFNGTRASHPDFLAAKTNAAVAAFALQMVTMPFFGRTAHGRGWKRTVAVTVVMFGALLPALVVLAARGAGRTPDDQVWDFFWATGVAGALGLPVPVAFALSRRMSVAWADQQRWLQRVGEEMQEATTDHKVRLTAGVGQGLLPGWAVDFVERQATFTTMLVIPVGVMLGNQGTKLGEAGRAADGPHEVAVLALCMVCAGWAVALGLMWRHERLYPPSATAGAVAAAAEGGGGGRLGLADFFPYRWLGDWQYMRYAMALCFLQFGHEAFFTLTGDHLYQMFHEAAFFDHGGFIGNVYTTGAGMVVVGLLATPLVIGPGHPNRERTICLVGLLSALANYYSWALAGNQVGVYMAQIVGFGALLTKPALSNLVAAVVGEGRESEAIGGLFSLGHVGSIVGVLAGKELFETIGQNAYFVLALGPVLAIVSLYARPPCAACVRASE